MNDRRGIDPSTLARRPAAWLGLGVLAHALGCGNGAPADAGHDASVPHVDAVADRGPALDAFDAARPDASTLDAFDAATPPDDGPALDAPADSGTDAPPALDVADAGDGSDAAVVLSPDAIPELRVRCGPLVGTPSVTAGSATAFVLRGRVVTPTGVLPAGEVLTTGGTIACVDVSCASNAAYAGATVIQTAGVIYPGLVDDHNHVAYDWLPPWPPPHLYGNHGQWQSESMHDGGPVVYDTFVEPYRDNVTAHFCAMTKYGEVRALVAGTTSIQGSEDRRCIRTLVRNLEDAYDFNGADPVRTNVLGIGTVTGTTLTSLQAAIASGDVTAYVIHLSEGVDATARAEFGQLVAKDLLGPATVIVHGTALQPDDIAMVGAAGAKVVWSPRSNVILYGRTTDIPSMLDAHVPVALAPDWTPSGGPNLLSEMRYARYVSNTAWGGRITTHDLFDMVTSRAADIIQRGTSVGRLAVGYDADVLVVPDSGCDAYDTLVDAPAADVELVMVNGRPLYGDAAVMTALPPALLADCEAVTACGVDKRVCVSEGAGAADGKDQTLADITAEIATFFPTPYPLVPLCP